MPTSNLTVFISYDHRDDWAKQMVQSVFKHGAAFDMPRSINTWVDSGSIPTGSQWQQEIMRGIRSCNVFFLLASKQHYSSSVAEEVGMAKALNKPIVPIYLGDLSALDQYHIGHLQGIGMPDLHDKDAVLAFGEAVARALRSLHLIS